MPEKPSLYTLVREEKYPEAARLLLAGNRADMCEFVANQVADYGSMLYMRPLIAEIRKQENQDPIKRIQAEIIIFLERNKGTAYSGFQIAEAHPAYTVMDIQEALGYLTDAGCVDCVGRRYTFARKLS